MALHVGIRHTEWIDADLHARLPEDQGCSDKLEDFVNTGVGHGVAANRNAGTVNHQIFPFIAVRAVIGVRETDINRFIEAAIGFQLAALYRIKPFRTFKIALRCFGPRPPE